MGWWSTEINGGDTSMDVEGILASFMGLDEEADDYDGVVESGKLTTEVVQAFLYVECTDGGHGFADRMIENGEGSILYTVLGALLMEAGAEIPKDFRTEIIQQAYLDRWAANNEERGVVIEEFIETLENYVDGTPTDLARGDFMSRATTPGYVGDTRARALFGPLTALMQRISAMLITNVKTGSPSTLWTVVGYKRGRLICRHDNTEQMFTEEQIRNLLGHERYEIKLYQLAELTATDL